MLPFHRACVDASGTESPDAGPRPIRPTYRALPRLRRLRSAADSLRGFGFAFDPRVGLSTLPRPPAPARTGARRRASRQMNSAIPPSTITAPSAIAIAAPPDSELSPVEDVVATVGTAVVVVGVVGPEGSDGENGLLPLFAVGAIALPVEAASTAAGDHSTMAPTTSHTTDRNDTDGPQRHDRP